MLTDCRTQLTFWTIGRQQVTVDFDGGQIVSDAGLLAVRDFEQRLGVIAGLAAQFPDLMQSVYGSTLMSYPAEFRTPEGKLFADTYKKVHNKEPDYAGQLGYVQATVLFEAIARAADKGTLKKGGLADELRKTDLQTPIGRVQFNDKGDNPNFMLYMAQHQNGKIVIVWPSDATTGKMNYPGVPW